MTEPIFEPSAIKTNMAAGLDLRIWMNTPAGYLKRCQAVSRTGAQCTRPGRHRAADETVTHKNGALTWTDPPTDTANQRLNEMAEERFAKYAPDLIAAVQPPSSPEGQLRAWWIKLAEQEADAVVPKAVEYSSTDLSDIGHQLARTQGRTVDDTEAAELGIYFYLLGKLSRWSGAVAQGKRPSDDTIYDLGIYCRMAQRNREAGNWPGVNLEGK